MDMNASVKKYLKGSKLQELMRIKEGDQSVKFYIKEGSDENHVDELLMFITGLSDLTSGDLTINGEQRDFETVLCHSLEITSIYRKYQSLTVI